MKIAELRNQLEQKIADETATNAERIAVIEANIDFLFQHLKLKKPKEST